MTNSIDSGSLSASTTDSVAEAQLAASQHAQTRHDVQQGHFYRGMRFAAKRAEMASAQHEIHHLHPLRKLKRRKPTLLTRNIRRNLLAEGKTGRTGNAQHRALRSPRDERHNQGGGQGREHDEQRDEQQRKKDALPVVKVRSAKRIPPAAQRHVVLAAVEGNERPAAQCESDMQTAWTRCCLDLARQLARDPTSAVTPSALGGMLDLNAARQFLGQRGIASRQAGLARVKQLLLAVQDGRPQPAGQLPAAERERNFNLLVPLMILHGDRPSTLRQLDLADNRLRSAIAAVSTESEVTLDTSQNL